VILHVVAVNDKKVFNEKGEEIPAVELKFDPSIYDKYISLINNPYIIACQDEIRNVDNFIVRHWLNSLVIERLHTKSEMILGIFSETGNDWEETFYRLLTRYFGFRVNTEPFEMLARALPFRIICKHADNRFQIEAMLFGTAGMLDEKLFREALSDRYYCDLIKEFKVLAAKYSLHPIHGWLWKFSKLRPANFATVRISQLAAMLSVSGGLFSRILESRDMMQIKEMFDVTASQYWDDHFVFGKKSRKVRKNTGTLATDIILINAVIPMLFVYGQKRNNNDFCERALDFLEDIRAEENTITAEWKSSGVLVESAFYSQALIQLRNNYCRTRRCLDCSIGSRLISMGSKLKDYDQLILEP
jgi:hypothetical protein